MPASHVNRIHASGLPLQDDNVHIDLPAIFALGKGMYDSYKDIKLMTASAVLHGKMLIGSKALLLSSMQVAAHPG